MKETFSWKDKRVLITGHTGFKGSWLSLLLKILGAEVWGYSLGPDTESHIHKELVRQQIIDRKKSKYADIRDRHALACALNESTPDVVFHLAAQPLVLESYRKPLETWETNLMGSLYLLDALTGLNKPTAVVIVTTDKVYCNNEWVHPYRETDELGGNDPYSASKAAAEIATASWRQSFANSSANNQLFIATARAGNVIGGGDWAKDRIIPDIVRALSAEQTIKLRSPHSTRPWQHVLEPLSGYLELAAKLYTGESMYQTAYNFGPALSSNQSVMTLANKFSEAWSGQSQSFVCLPSLHKESYLLHVDSTKAWNDLNWTSCWNFLTTIEKTCNWYKQVISGDDLIECCVSDVTDYLSARGQA